MYILEHYEIVKYGTHFCIIDHNIGINGMFIREGNAINYSMPPCEQNAIKGFNTRDDAMRYLKSVVR